MNSIVINELRYGILNEEYARDKKYKINTKMSRAQFSKLNKKRLNFDINPVEDVSDKINIPNELRGKSGIYFIHAKIEDLKICYIGISTELNTRIQSHSHNSNCTWLLKNIDNARMEWLYVSDVILSRADLEPLESYLIKSLMNEPNVVLLNDTVSVNHCNSSINMRANIDVLKQHFDDFECDPVVEVKEDRIKLDNDLRLAINNIEIDKVYNRTNFLKALKIYSFKDYNMSADRFYENIKWSLFFYCTLSINEYNKQIELEDGHLLQHIKIEYIVTEKY